MLLSIWFLSRETASKYVPIYVIEFGSFSAEVGKRESASEYVPVDCFLDLVHLERNSKLIRTDRC